MIFADATNKKAGEFYTPCSVVRLLVSILDPKEGEFIYDPACGTGGMLLEANLSIPLCVGGGTQIQTDAATGAATSLLPEAIAGWLDSSRKVRESLQLLLTSLRLK